MAADRSQRRHQTPPSDSPGAPDTRKPFQKDRDRLIYTSALRRLAGVTQVVGPLEGHIFHNRLTHTLEVAQIARRLAERLHAEYSATFPEAAELNPDVVEAAALAHDIGHPPYGHIAEKALNGLTRAAGGFEGNAQSFRILATLAVYKPGVQGLNLTRATLNAVLKYPWFRGEGPANKPDKWGAYETESDDFAFARGDTFDDQHKCLEADIMDHADAVAYSVHDVDDFHRAGLIPLERIQDEITDHIADFKANGRGVTAGDVDTHEGALRSLVETLPPLQRHTGTQEDRATLRSLTARLIGDFVMPVKLKRAEDGHVQLEVPGHRNVQMRFLQRLLWRYVIDSPRLATQQHGQRRVIEGLFRMYQLAIAKEQRALIPAAFLQQFDRIATGSANEEAEIVRMAADIVASLTDHQATRLYRRMCGIEPGSVTENLDG